jgi:ribosome-binding protein aMBF1 (putative translation factor)
MSEITLEEALARLAKLESEAADRVKCRKVLDRNKETIGYWLYQRRCAAGLNLPELAKKSGVHAVSISHIERGGSPTLRLLKKLSDAMGCKTWEIIKDWEEQA